MRRYPGANARIPDKDKRMFFTLRRPARQCERSLQAAAQSAYAEDSTEQLEEDANLIIMRVGEEDGEEYLDVVDDDEELYEVSDMFARRLEELYDIDLNGGQ